MRSRALIPSFSQGEKGLGVECGEAGWRDPFHYRHGVAAPVAMRPRWHRAQPFRAWSPSYAAGADAIASFLNSTGLPSHRKLP